MIATTRFSMDTAESVVMVTHSCFFDKSPHPAHKGFRRIVLNGRVRRILIEARTVNHSMGSPMEDFKWDDCVSSPAVANFCNCQVEWTRLAASLVRVPISSVLGVGRYPGDSANMLQT